MIVLILCWCTCSIGYYVLAYVLKYLNGNVFLNGYASAAGEIAGKLSTIPILKYFSLKRVFLLAFGMCIMSLTLLMLFIESDTLTPFLVLMNRFWFSLGYVLSYLSVILLYPTILASTASGFCVLSSKGVTIFAPMIAELRPPINLVIVLSVSISAAIASQFLKDDKDNDDQKGTNS